MGITKNYQKALQICEENREFEILEYIKGKSPKLKLKCLSCGNIFERYQCHFIQYPHVCPKCAPKGKRQFITLQEAQNRIDQIYGKDYLTLISYKGNNVKIDIKCEKCGLIFQSVPSSLWRGRLKGCPFCEQQKSKGESLVEKILRENKIQYISQARFPECKDQLMLPFDFYLPQYNVCIEFQSEQHYDSSSRFWSEKLIQHDKIKENYCKEKNIKLIQIPYYDINNIEKYFKFLKK